MSLPPVNWRPSPNHWIGRGGRLPLAEVKHRIVGTLPSARSAFASTSRQASSHFGIGYVNGKLSVDQYVDLSDSAWCNGDAREPTWPLFQAGVNPNLTTISTEHEDGGEANRGRISEEVWQASIELSRLLHSGDLARIRAAGIRVSDRSPTSAAKLVSVIAGWPIDTTRYIDHNQISGPNKPYCLRRWLDDPGFVEGNPSRRDRLLAALNGEDDMPALSYDPHLWKANPGGTSLREQASLSAPVTAVVPEGTVILSVGVVSGQEWRQVIAAVDNKPERLLFALRNELVPTPVGPDDVLHTAIASVVNARIDQIEGKPAPDDTAEVTRLQAALDSANTRTATVKTKAAASLRLLAGASTDLATGARAAADSIEKL